MLRSNQHSQERSIFPLSFKTVNYFRSCVASKILQHPKLQSKLSHFFKAYKLLDYRCNDIIRMNSSQRSSLWAKMTPWNRRNSAAIDVGAH